MKKISIIILIMWMVFTLSSAKAKAPDRELRDYSVKELVSHFAKEYKVSEKQMLVTMSCESGFHENAIGDGGKSFGLSQIFLPAHPTVTKEQALDKVYATKFMASEFKLGHQKKWTCWRNNFM